MPGKGAELLLCLHTNEQARIFVTRQNLPKPMKTPSSFFAYVAVALLLWGLWPAAAQSQQVATYRLPRLTLAVDTTQYPYNTSRVELNSSMLKFQYQDQTGFTISVMVANAVELARPFQLPVTDLQQAGGLEKILEGMRQVEQQGGVTQPLQAEGFRGISFRITQPQAGQVRSMAGAALFQQVEPGIYVGISVNDMAPGANEKRVRQAAETFAGNLSLHPTGTTQTLNPPDQTAASSAFSEYSARQNRTPFTHQVVLRAFIEKNYSQQLQQFLAISRKVFPFVMKDLAQDLLLQGYEQWMADNVTDSLGVAYNLNSFKLMPVPVSPERPQTPAFLFACNFNLTDDRQPPTHSQLTYVEYQPENPSVHTWITDSVVVLRALRRTLDRDFGKDSKFRVFDFGTELLVWNRNRPFREARLFTDLPQKVGGIAPLVIYRGLHKNMNGLWAPWLTLDMGMMNMVQQEHPDTFQAVMNSPQLFPTREYRLNRLVPIEKQAYAHPPVLCDFFGDGTPTVVRFAFSWTALRYLHVFTWNPTAHAWQPANDRLQQLELSEEEKVAYLSRFAPARRFQQAAKEGLAKFSGFADE